MIIKDGCYERGEKVIIALVRVVRLSASRWYPMNVGYSYGWLDVVPVPLLTQLPNLRRLDLELPVDPTCQPLSPSRFTLSALRVYSAPIQHLELHGAKFLRIDDLMRYLRAFPSLSRLMCSNVSLEKEVPPSTGIVSLYGLKLTSLEVSSPQ